MKRKGFYTFIPCESKGKIEGYQVLYAGMAIGYFTLDGILNEKWVNASDDSYFTEYIKTASNIISNELFR